MIKSLLYYVFFLLFSFQINGTEDEAPHPQRTSPLLSATGATNHGAQEKAPRILQPSEHIDGPGSEQPDSILTSPQLQRNAATSAASSMIADDPPQDRLIGDGSASAAPAGSSFLAEGHAEAPPLNRLIGDFSAPAIPSTIQRDPSSGQPDFALRSRQSRSDSSSLATSTSFTDAFSQATSASSYRDAPSLHILSDDRSRESAAFSVPQQVGDIREILNLSDDDGSDLLERGILPDYIPATEGERAFFLYLNEAVFGIKDPLSSFALRWLFRGVGFLAENAMIPMLLFVVLNLFDVTPGDPLDTAVIALSMAYFFLPSVENMSQLGHEVGQSIANLYHKYRHPRAQVAFQTQTPYEIPALYRGLRPNWTIPLQVASNLHAASMALILTTVFHHIENSNVAHYDWFFLTCFAPFALQIFYKNRTFFHHGKRIERAHHASESNSEKLNRKILEEEFRKFELRLRELHHQDLKDLYDFLRNPDNSACAKLAKIKNVIPNRAIANINEGVSEALLSRAERQNYYRPRDIRDMIPGPLKNIIFYGSTYTEFAFLQYGFDLFGQNIGLEGSIAQPIISYSGAGIFTITSFFFEDESIIEYYNNIFRRRLGSSQSVSNPITRTGIEITAIAGGTLVALSETYPAWNTLLRANYGSYALLAWMVGRHLPRNAFGLASGFNRALTNWHLRNCGRDRCCCTNCRRGKGADEMINFISSQFMRKLFTFTDQLNAEGVELLYNAFFRHKPAHE